MLGIVKKSQSFYIKSGLFKLTTLYPGHNLSIYGNILQNLRKKLLAMFDFLSKNYIEHL